MAYDTHIYFGLENLGLTGPQKLQLLTALNLLGPSSDSQPAHLNHRRVRTDNDAVIYEALFDQEHISISSLKTYLGNVYGISPTLISHTVTYQTFATLPSAVVTFTYQSVARLRIVFFGKGSGSWPTWPQSWAEATAYVAGRATEWGQSLAKG